MMYRNVALAVLVLQMGIGAVAEAKPSFARTNANSCREGCHASVEVGRMSVVGEDTLLDLGTQLDGNTRGPLKTFIGAPGETVTLSMDVLDGTSVFAAQLKRLETGGQLNDLNNLLSWLEDNEVSNPWTLQELANPAYFTKDDGSDGGLPANQAGVFSFDLFIDPETPADVYDLEFAVAGDDADWYQDEHFYLVVTDTSSYPQLGETPSLQGLEPEKPNLLPISVQAAYNDDTMFFHISWEGDRGDTHDDVHFTQGVWQQEGFPRREAQSTLDDDPDRGPTNRTSTIYESRVTFMIDDPNGPNAVPDFAQLGCYVTCHDDSRAMSLWDPSTNLTKYLNDGTNGSLDLWHHRLARANPIGASDDQYVTAIPPGGSVGGRFGDQGDSPWQTNNIVEGVPTYALDPTTSEFGEFAFSWDDLFASADRFFRRDDAPENGAGMVTIGIPYADAVTAGYVPAEGDTIPRRRLRQPTGSRGDISGFDTTFTPSPTNPLFGRIDSNTQRLLNTGNSDDTALAPDGVYNIAFAVHTGLVTVRDHYVGFAMTLSLGETAADIQAVNVAGSGRDVLPDFSDMATFPVTDVNLFQPGIASLEFLIGANEGLEWIDPVTEQEIDQVHGGASSVVGGAACTDCHTGAAMGEPDPPLFDAGSMELLSPQRGGVNTPTPLPVPEPSGVVLQLVAIGGLALVGRARRQADRRVAGADLERAIAVN